MPYSYVWTALPGILALAGAAHAQPAAFAPVAAYGTGGNSAPIGLAVADVNGDGKPDLLTANSSAGTAGVLLGTGTGSFGTVTQFSVGAGGQPYGIAVADVNGDGKPDLLAVSYGSSTVAVLPGMGTGSFGAAVQFSTGAGSNPVGLAVADVNGDGKLDVVTANYIGRSVSVLLGTGTGGFGAATSYSLGNYPRGIAVADVNGDSRPDLLTTNYSNNTVGVLLGTGSGSFGAVTTYGAGGSPIGLVVADVSGDGKLDVVTANETNSSAGVLLGTGTGSFGTVMLFSTGAGSYPQGIVVADVNGDGKRDLLTVNQGNSTVGVLLGTGLGSFGTVTQFGTGSSSGPRSLAVADLNGDGRPDIATANPDTNAAGVLLNAGTYTPLAAAASLDAAAVTLYPNPVGGCLHVRVPALAGAVQVTLLDALGRVVRRPGAAPAGGGTLTLETSGLAAGVYTLRLQAGATILARRVVLE